MQQKLEAEQSGGMLLSEGESLFPVGEQPLSPGVTKTFPSTSQPGPVVEQPLPAGGTKNFPSSSEPVITNTQACSSSQPVTTMPSQEVSDNMLLYLTVLIIINIIISSEF